MRAVLAVLCDFALVSADGKPSIIGIFDTIRAPNVPFLYPRFAFAARFESDAIPTPASHNVQLTMQDPSGGVVVNTGGPIVINPGQPGQAKSFFDSQMFFDGYVFQTFGVYTLSVAIDGILLATTQLHIVRVQVG